MANLSEVLDMFVRITEEMFCVRYVVSKIVISDYVYFRQSMWQ